MLVSHYLVVIRVLPARNATQAGCMLVYQPPVFPAMPNRQSTPGNSARIVPHVTRQTIGMQLSTTPTVVAREVVLIIMVLVVLHAIL
jgi:hypothetical protein